ncbi:hypothetical protein [Agrobacterium sp. NPDC090283]|uniref:hypothetical protein n=1 Tax=Agrobacterium sp. NPDC090283 TaxID=3363920 RepID=UPI00383BCCD4
MEISPKNTVSREIHISPPMQRERWPAFDRKGRKEIRKVGYFAFANKVLLRSGPTPDRHRHNRTFLFIVTLFNATSRVF